MVMSTKNEQTVQWEKRGLGGDVLNPGRACSTKLTSIRDERIISHPPLSTKILLPNHCSTLSHTWWKRHQIRTPCLLTTKTTLIGIVTLGLLWKKFPYAYEGLSLHQGPVFFFPPTFLRILLLQLPLPPTSLHSLPDPIRLFLSAYKHTEVPPI